MTEILEPIPDLALLRKVLAQIDAEPEHWDQRWVEVDADRVDADSIGKCGTLRCVAGWACYFVDGKVPGAATAVRRAQVLLGLTDHEANWLFTGMWDTPDRQRRMVQAIAEDIAERAGERL